MARTIAELKEEMWDNSKDNMKIAIQDFVEKSKGMDFDDNEIMGVIVDAAFDAGIDV